VQVDRWLRARAGVRQP